VIQYDKYKHRVVEPTWNSDIQRYIVEEWKENSTEMIRSTCFTDSQYVKYSIAENMITAGDKYTNEQYRRFEDSSNFTGLLKMTPDQQWLIAIDHGYLSKLAVWNFTTGQLQSSISTPNSIWFESNCVIISTDWVAVGWSSVLVIYRLPLLVTLCRMHSDSVITACAHVQNPTTFTHTFAVCKVNGDVNLWSCPADFTNAVGIHKLINVSTYYVTTCCFIMTGDKLLTAGQDTRLTNFSTSIIKMWDVQTGRLIENEKDE